MLVCLRCKAPIYRDEFKELDGGKYHTYCHRSLIVERYTRILDEISAEWRWYRMNWHPVNRAIHRTIIRHLIAEYRELSF
jgi:hypothetical protein